MKKKLYAILTLTLVVFCLLMPQFAVFANDGGYLFKVYVCTTDGYLNMREEPNTDSRILYALPDCADLEIIDVDGNWGYAYYGEGDIVEMGWIYLPGTKSTYREARDNAGKSISETVYVNAPEGYVNLRSEPTTAYDNIYCEIPNNSELFLTRRTDKGWALTSYGSYTGWIALSETQKEPVFTPEVPEEEEYIEIPEPIAEVEEERGMSFATKPLFLGSSFLMIALGVLALFLLIIVITLLIVLANHGKSTPLDVPTFETTPEEDVYDETTESKNDDVSL